MQPVTSAVGYEDAMLESRLILVEHALPELRADLAPRHWQLGAAGSRVECRGPEGQRWMVEVIVARAGPLSLIA